MPDIETLLARWGLPDNDEWRPVVDADCGSDLIDGGADAR